MRTSLLLLRRALVAAGLWLVCAPIALAADTQVAATANFSEPAKEIAAAFTAKTGHHVVLTFGGSREIYSQIAKGAPFEVFLSSDAALPAKAEKDGLAVPGTRFNYAIGALALYSKTPGLVDAKGEVLKSGKFSKIAIADPGAAPYGEYAVQTMTKLGVYDALRPKLVKGANTTEVFKMIDTGAADLGFVSRSQVIHVTGGSRWLVPAGLHAEIDQQAVLLKTGADNPAAKAFLAFLKGPEAKAVIRRYGYQAR